MTVTNVELTKGQWVLVSSVSTAFQCKMFNYDDAYCYVTTGASLPAYNPENGRGNDLIIRNSNLYNFNKTLTENLYAWAVNNNMNIAITENTIGLLVL